MINPLRLYYNWRSLYSNMVRLQIAEKNLDVELIEIDLAAGEQYQPNYLSWNPLGQVIAKLFHKLLFLVFILYNYILCILYDTLGTLFDSF